MAVNLTKELADTLCTIIAVGFIKANESLASVKEIAENCSTVTKFIYPPKDKEEHMQLKDKFLHYYDVELKLEPGEEDKTIQPLIVAKSPKLYDKATLEGLPQDFHEILGYLERTVDKIKQEMIEKLPGAYIGAMADLNKIELSGPSHLYLYPPTYRTSLNKDEIGSIKDDYNLAKDVSNILLKFLVEARIIKGKRKLIFREEISKNREITEIYESGKLFASCHGMILAIYDYYFNTTMENSACIEIALGKDTCKVASCLPCSLLMCANNISASATHLGRGDNWRYPKGEDNASGTLKWKETVQKTYNLGLKNPKISDVPKVKDFIKYMSGYSNDRIPEIFLESLTYQGSFVSKINNTLP